MRESYQDRKALPFVIILGRSYNLPKFCASTTWYPQAVTFANETTVGTQPVGLFVNTKNSVYVAARTLDLVQVWLPGSSIPSSNISGGLNQSLSVFVTIGGDVYVDNSVVNGRVDKWALNATSSVPAMYVNSTCYHISLSITTMTSIAHSEINIASFGDFSLTVRTSQPQLQAMVIMAAPRTCSAIREESLLWTYICTSQIRATVESSAISFSHRVFQRWQEMVQREPSA